MKTRATAGFTPSRSRAPRAVRNCGHSTAAVKRSRPTTRWHSASHRSKRGRSSPSRDWGDTIWRAWPSDGAAVAELRRRKHRDQKPLAIMVRDIERGPRALRGVAGRRSDPDIVAAADRSVAPACRARRSPRWWRRGTPRSA